MFVSRVEGEVRVPIREGCMHYTKQSHTLFLRQLDLTSLRTDFDAFDVVCINKLVPRAASFVRKHLSSRNGPGRVYDTDVARWLLGSYCLAQAGVICVC